MFLNVLFNSEGIFLFNLMLFVLLFGALVVSLTIHEFAHAWAATKLGDLTAKSLGRLTLNPKSHLDTLGTFFLLFAGFGWGKPVPFNPYNLKHPKRDSALIALAGPASNILLAAALAIFYHFLTFTGIEFLDLARVFIRICIQYNLVLGIFNLIPVEPLDGFKIVNGVLPHDLSMQWLQMRPYGLIVLLVLVFTGMTEKIIVPLLAVTLRFLGL